MTLPTEYFIDESGNTGDLLKAGEHFSFGNQEVFSLVAIGVSDKEGLQAELDRLKTKYRIQSSELKASLIVDKPKLVKELIDYLHQVSAPVIMEVVDKRYMIIANIVNTMVLTPVANFDVRQEAAILRNVTAEFLMARAPGELLELYLSACAQPSNEQVERVFDCFSSWLSSLPSESPMARGTLQCVRENWADLKSSAYHNPEAWRDILPIPDIGKRGKAIWMLPNLTSLCCIYARVNELHSRRLSKVRMIHDEQMQFDGVLEGAKSFMDGIGTERLMPHTLTGDWNFQESASLEFARSHDHAGIQAADIIAGFLSRYVRNVIVSGGEPSAMTRYSFHLLRRNTLGINMVLSFASVKELVGSATSLRFS